MSIFIEVSLNTGEIVTLEVVAANTAAAAPSFNLFGFQQDARIEELYSVNGERS
jgi:hypothetical protein